MTGTCQTHNHKNREREIKSCSLSLCKCLKITLLVLDVLGSDFRSGYEGFCTFFSKFRKEFFVVTVLEKFLWLLCVWLLLM